jgi:hypothetical protein
MGKSEESFVLFECSTELPVALYMFFELLTQRDGWLLDVAVAVE